MSGLPSNDHARPYVERALGRGSGFAGLLVVGRTWTGFQGRPGVGRLAPESLRFSLRMDYLGEALSSRGPCISARLRDF